jgi:hypothetical protein
LFRTYCAATGCGQQCRKQHHREPQLANRGLPFASIRTQCRRGRLGSVRCHSHPLSFAQITRRCSYYSINAKCKEILVAMSLVNIRNWSGRERQAPIEAVPRPFARASAVAQSTVRLARRKIFMKL